MTTAHEDALSLAATLNPGILARALDCEKHVAAHPHNPDATESIRKAGVSYRRQLADVAAVIEPVLRRYDTRDEVKVQNNLFNAAKQECAELIHHINELESPSPRRPRDPCTCTRSGYEGHPCPVHSP
jgi:hypothetical protein